MAPKRGRGFTLLELLVVIILVGVVVTFGVLAVGDGGRASRIQDEAKRLHALMSLISEESVLLTRTIGLELYPDSYRFLAYDSKNRTWSPPVDRLFKERTLPEVVQLKLYLEGLPVNIEEDELLVEEPEEEVVAEGEEEPRGIAETRAQILFYASGERTPFELVVGPEEGDPRFRIIGEMFGKLTLEGPLDPLL